MWGNVAVTQAYLTLSEVLGHIDLLVARRARDGARRRTGWSAFGAEVAADGRGARVRQFTDIAASTVSADAVPMDMSSWSRRGSWRARTGPRADRPITRTAAPGAGDPLRRRTRPRRGFDYVCRRSAILGFSPDEWCADPALGAAGSIPTIANVCSARGAPRIAEATRRERHRVPAAAPRRPCGVGPRRGLLVATTDGQALARRHVRHHRPQGRRGGARAPRRPADRGGAARRARPRGGEHLGAHARGRRGRGRAARCRDRRRARADARRGRVRVRPTARPRRRPAGHASRPGTARKPATRSSPANRVVADWDAETRFEHSPA